MFTAGAFARAQGGRLIGIWPDTHAFRLVLTHEILLQIDRYCSSINLKLSTQNR